MRVAGRDRVSLLAEMVGYLQFAQLARTANARIRSARELERRWRALGPEGQAEARVELDRLTAALKDVRERIAAGPRGFVREFKAAYRGEDSGPIEEPTSLGALLGELHSASTALRDKLDAVEDAQAAADAPPAPVDAAIPSDDNAPPAPDDAAMSSDDAATDTASAGDDEGPEPPAPAA